MISENAASAATAKPCPIEPHPAAAAISKVLMDHLAAVSASHHVRGEFRGDSGAAAFIAEIAAAHSGLEQIVEALIKANAEVALARGDWLAAEKEATEANRSARLSHAEVERLKSLAAPKSITVGEREYVLVEPEAGTNPEALAYARLQGKSRGRADEAIYNFDFGGRQVSMRGKADDLDTLIRVGQFGKFERT